MRSSTPPTEPSSPGINNRPFSDSRPNVVLHQQNSTSNSLEAAVSDTMKLAESDKTVMRITRPGVGSTTRKNIILEKDYCMDIVLLAVLILLERYNPDTDVSFLCGPSGPSPLEALRVVSARQVRLERERSLLDILETVHSIRQAQGSPQGSQIEVCYLRIEEDLLPTGTAQSQHTPAVRVSDAFLSFESTQHLESLAPAGSMP